MTKLRWWPLAAIVLWSSAAEAKLWSQGTGAPPSSVTRDGAPVAGVDDGHALVVQAGIDVFGGAGAAAWQLDPGTRAWKAIASVPARSCEALVGLGDGTFLCAYGDAVGGATRSTTGWLWSPATSTWTATAAMTSDRASPAAARLADGRALFCGGRAPGAAAMPLTSCELYDPVAKSWRAAAAMPEARFPTRNMVALPDGRAAIVATDASGALPRPALFYDPKADAWTTATGSIGASPGMVVGTRSGAIVFVGPAGKIYAVDATSGAAAMLDAPTGFQASVLTPVGDRWVLLLGTPAMSIGEPLHAALLDTKSRTYRAIPAPPGGAGLDYVVGSAGDAAFVAGGARFVGTSGSTMPVDSTDVITMARDGAACSDPDTCSSLACVGGKCGAACTGDADCATGTACDGGACVASLALGATCARDGLCGSGHCLDGHCCGDTKGCAPYTCAAGGGCATSCSDVGQCAKGNVCVAGACVPDPTTATCSGDRTQSVPKGGQPIGCAPLLCDPSKGSCRTTCEQSDHCASGYQCDPASSRCISVGGGGGDSGGCAVAEGAEGAEGREGDGALARFAALFGAIGAIGALRRRGRRGGARAQ